jgi:predicted nucleic acid-binding protein
MSADGFFDSNVLLYTAATDPRKAAHAARILRDGGTVSVQVLNEFAHVALRKLSRPITEVRRALSEIREICVVVPLDIDTHELGLDIAERYRLSVFDSMIVASALLAGCGTLYTEDLQHGQVIDGLAVRDPFRG